MAFCDLCDTCFFFSEPLIDKLSSDAAYLRGNYCEGEFTECAIYRLAKSYGSHKVPGYFCPDDMPEFLNFSQSEPYEPQGGPGTLLKVIHADGTLSTARTASVGNLAQSGEIVAYQCSGKWIEVRRKSNMYGYRGPERRKAGPAVGAEFSH